MEQLRHSSIYRKLLWLYPRPYRGQYGPQMIQTLDDMLAAAPTGKERRRVLVRAALDLPVSITHQQLSHIGDIMVHETPRYVKRNTIIAGVLLLPFIAALTANGLDKVIHHQTLYQSWLWHSPVLALWVLWLPTVAMAVALGSLLVYVAQRYRSARSRADAVTELTRTWPLVATALISLGTIVMVFGHDSVHCVIGNPVHEVQHLNQTWQCIQGGRVQYPFHNPLGFVKRTLGLQ